MPFGCALRLKLQFFNILTTATQLIGLNRIHASTNDLTLSVRATASRWENARTQSQRNLVGDAAALLEYETFNASAIISARAYKGPFVGPEPSWCL